MTSASWNYIIRFLVAFVIFGIIAVTGYWLVILYLIGHTAIATGILACLTSLCVTYQSKEEIKELNNKLQSLLTRLDKSKPGFSHGEMEIIITATHIGLKVSNEKGILQKIKDEV